VSIIQVDLRGCDAFGCSLAAWLPVENGTGTLAGSECSLTASQPHFQRAARHGNRKIADHPSNSYD
jgi:hypothetical protein